MSRETLVSNVSGLLGGLAGGLLGAFLYGQILKVGLYAPILTGALFGLGCSLLARHRSPARGAACAAIALPLSVLAEWWHRPFVKDGSLGYFLAHLGELNQGWVAFALMGLGAALAYWWGADARSAPAA